MKSRSIQPGAIANLLWIGLAVAFPLIVRGDGYFLHVAITIFFNIIFAITMWMIYQVGAVSFAHAGFLGLGAYVAGILATKVGLPFWLTALISGGGCGLAGLMIGLPLMRTKAVYFFMASWAVGEIMKRLFAMARSLTGGWNGMRGITAPSIGSISFTDRTAYFYLVLGLCLLVLLLVFRINRSRAGLILWSIQEAETLSSHLGVNVTRQKVGIFTLSCAIVGISGAFFAHYQGYLNPKMFDVWQSEFGLVFMIVGGLRNFAGPILGACGLTLINELLRPLGYYRVIMFGVILVLTILYVPNGLYYQIQHLPKLLLTRLQRKQRKAA